MDSPKPTIDKQLYVESLVWRQRAIRSRLEALRLEVQALQKEENELIQEVRALELLIGVATEDGVAHSQTMAGAGQAPDGAIAIPDFGSWGPTSREIYQRVYEVIRDAGVPLHYRVLAEQVREKVALSGADPGATLIAHLHRAPDVFPRLGRGIYGISGMADRSAKSEGASSNRRGRRVRRRRIV